MILPINNCQSVTVTKLVSFSGYVRRLFTYYVLRLTKRASLPINVQRGFTLIELITVMAIIGVLATIGINTFPGAFRAARDSQRLDDTKKITAAVQLYYTDNNRYPPSSGCDPGWCNSGAGGSSQTTWIGGLVSTYLPSVPQDPKDLSSPDLLYYYTTSGDDYCLEVHQEKDATLSRNYSGTSGSGANQVWKLRFGPEGPTGGICGTR